MRIGNKYIGRSKPVFIVAEAGLAHDGDLKKALELIDVARKGGADAVKFQIYRTKEFIDQKRSPELYERFKKKELSFKAFSELQQYAKGEGILWFATPHTISGLEHLRQMGVPLYKIGSGEKGSKLFGKILDVGKPTFISTGMREQSEVLRMIDLYGGKKTAFLHCVTMYPVHPHLANLGFIKKLITACNWAGSLAGYSCHMTGTHGVEVAVAMGAKIIEKHIKLKDSKGQDTLCALFGDEFKAMVKKIRHIETMIDEEDRVYGSLEKESESWALKRKDGKRPL